MFKKSLVVLLLIVGFSQAANIEDLIKKALENDFKAKSLKYQYEASIYKTKQEESQKKPQILFNSYLGWQQYNPYYGGEKSQILKYYYIALKQVVFRPQIDISIVQSKIREKIAKLKLEQEKQYIKYLFFNLLYDYLYNKEKLHLINKLYKTKKRQLSLLKKLYINKKATKEDLIRVELELISTLQNLKSLQISLSANQKRTCC